MYAQGDLLIVPVDKFPDGVKECTPPDKVVVLALGESTGHRHAVYGDDVKLYRRQGTDVDLLERPNIPMETVEQWIDVATKAMLKHEEHKAIELPKGKYRVIRQREYDPKADRFVAD